MLIEYAIEADSMDDSAVAKDGLIKVVKGESLVICERKTSRTNKRQVEIKCEQTYDS